MKKLYLTVIAAGTIFALASCGSNDVPVSLFQGETKAVETSVNSEEVKELTGSAEGFGGTITVTLKMKGEDITEASILGNDESPDVGGAALSELEKQLVEKDSFDIDGVSGATYTSEGVRNAVKDALGLFLPSDETSKAETKSGK